MITRIVKMQFRPEAADTFLEIYKEIHKHIETYPGCRGLTLLRDIKDPSIFFTYSHWDTEEDLDSYRGSNFFQDTWARTKDLFTEKAEVWTVGEWKA